MSIQEVELELIRDQAAVAAVFGHPRAARVAGQCLAALTHRGGGSAGVITTRSDSFNARYDRSEVLLSTPSSLDTLLGTTAIAQLYSVRADQAPEAAWFDVVDLPRQPAVGFSAIGPVAIGLVGKITNYEKLRLELLETGAIFRSDSHAELILYMIGRSNQRTAVNRLVDTLWQLEGSFGVVMATADTLVAVRDPYGLRPLLLGKVDGATLVVSEDSAIHRVGGQVTRDIAPGEMAIVDATGESTVFPFAKRQAAPCALEPVRISAMGARWEGWANYRVQRDLGEALAREHRVPVDVSLVIPADEHARAAAQGFSQATNIPVEEAMLMRADAPPRVLSGIVQGQRVALIVGSTLSGARIRSDVQALRQAGVLDVHVRILTPRITRTCPYGVMMTYGEDEALMGRDPSEATPPLLGATSFAWLSLERMSSVLSLDAHSQSRCLACMGGELPVPIVPPLEQLALFEETEESGDSA